MIIGAGSTAASAGAPFRTQGIDLLPYSDGASALLDLVAQHPDVIVAPSDMVGVDLLRFIDAVTQWAAVPVVVGVRDGDTERAFEALERGARCLVALPVTAEQLSSALRLIGRARPASMEELVVGGLKLNPQSHRVLHGGVDVPLGLREFEVLHFLMRESPRAVRVEDILEALPDGEGTIAGIRNAVMRLRKRLVQARPDVPDPITTIIGSGYRLAP
jgi:DNA-binding response OmpR family regulator